MNKSSMFVYTENNVESNYMGLCKSKYTTQPNNMVSTLAESCMLFSLELHNILTEKRYVVMSGFSTELVMYTGYTINDEQVTLYEISHYNDEIPSMYKQLEEQHKRIHTTIHDRNKIEQSKTVFIFDASNFIVSYFIVNDVNTYANHSLHKYDHHMWSIKEHLTDRYTRVSYALLIELVCYKYGRKYTYSIQIKRNKIFKMFIQSPVLYYAGNILDPDYIVLALNAK